MIKKITLIFILFFMNIHVLALDVSSKNVILYNYGDNKVLYTKNENQRVQIASLTKIMTAIIALEKIKNLDKKVILRDDDFKGLAEQNLVTAGFSINEEVTYRDLLYGLLIKSGAECAKGLVNNLGGEKKFIELMNNKAKNLKLINTYFSNYIGLDDENNYSTAKEVSIIFMEALKNKEFKKIITTSSYTSFSGKHVFKNNIKKNENVGDYLLGGKTGTTDGAGLCLASIASTNDTKFLLVTLGAPYDKKGPHNFEDAGTIYKYYIDNYGYKTILKKSDIMLSLKTKFLKKDKIDFYPDDDIKVYLANNFNKKDLVYKYDGEKVINVNMKRGQKLGVLDVYYKGENLISKEIILKENPKASLTKLFNEYKYVIICLFSFVFLVYIARKIK